MASHVKPRHRSCPPATCTQASAGTRPRGNSDYSLAKEHEFPCGNPKQSQAVVHRLNRVSYRSHSHRGEGDHSVRPVPVNPVANDFFTGSTDHSKSSATRDEPAARCRCILFWRIENRNRIRPVDHGPAQFQVTSDGAICLGSSTLATPGDGLKSRSLCLAATYFYARLP